MSEGPVPHPVDEEGAVRYKYMCPKCHCTQDLPDDLQLCSCVCHPANTRKTAPARHVAEGIPMSKKPVLHPVDGKPWDTCYACGGVINPYPKNYGGAHKCDALDWARHQGALLGDIRDMLAELISPDAEGSR